MAKQRGAKKRSQRSYSDDDRANALAALDANGGDVARTAKQVGIPRLTLREWSKGRVHPAVLSSQQVKKVELSDRLKEIVYQLLDCVPAKLNKASLQQVFVAVGIAVEKMQLLNERPTSITQTGTLSDEERVNAIRAILARAGYRLVGPVLNGNGDSHRPVAPLP